MAHLLAGERPTEAASPGRFLLGFWRSVARGHAARRQRVALETLLDLDPHRLDDLGLRYQDIREALQRPRGATSGLALRRARRANAWLRST